jgi:hypothetical protein
MISCHIYRNLVVGCGSRLLAELALLIKQLAISLSRKISGKWLVLTSTPQPCFDRTLK